MSRRTLLRLAPLVMITCTLRLTGPSIRAFKAETRHPPGSVFDKAFAYEAKLWITHATSSPARISVNTPRNQI